MLLKEIGRKIAQAFRSARAADEKVASSIAAALDAKAEQIKEYEKRFEPEPPEPDLPQEINAASLFTFEFYLAGIPIAQAMAAAARCSSDEMASAILKVIAQKPELLSHQTNNWRKMHGLPMHRKPASFRRRRKGLKLCSDSSRHPIDSPGAGQHDCHGFIRRHGNSRTDLQLSRMVNVRSGCNY